MSDDNLVFIQNVNPPPLDIFQFTQEGNLKITASVTNDNPSIFSAGLTAEIGRAHV